MISFVVPIFNVSKYLEICVHSISSQSFRNIEIILVDDGSFDESPTLCDQLALQDTRIKVIHKENGGASDARNTGLMAATGDYVVFVDGDDFWRDEAQLATLMQTVDAYPYCDFIGFNCAYYYPNSNKYVPWVEYATCLQEPVDNNKAMIELVKSGTFPMSPCLKLIKRDFLVKNELLFLKGQTAEDIPWFINLLEQCEYCCFFNQYIYAYRQNVAGSVTQSCSERSFNNLFNILKAEIKQTRNRRFNNEAQNALLSFLAYELCILFTHSNLSKETKKELLSYSWLIDYDINPKVKMVKKVKNIFGMKVAIWLLKLYQRRRRNKK